MANSDCAAFGRITSRTWRIASLPIGIRSTPSKKLKEGTYQSQKRPLHPGRFHPGMVGDFISERWAISNRNGGRFHFGMVGDFERNQQGTVSRRLSGRRNGIRADHIVNRIRNLSGNVLLFSSGHFLRVLAARGLGLDAGAGRLFVLDTASLSIVGYEHDQTEPVIRLWNDARHVVDQLAPDFAHRDSRSRAEETQS